MAVEAPPGVAELVAGELKPVGGPAARDNARSWALGIWAALALLYLFIPIFVIVAFSFNDPKGRFNFTWQGFTLDHWAHPFANPDLALGDEELVLDRADLDGRSRPRSGRSWRWRWCATGSAGARRSTSSCSCRCRRPRS